MNDGKLHRFEASVAGIAVPERLNDPFEYAPHPLAAMAAEQVRTYVASQSQWHDELQRGKMLGVLVVRHQGDGTLGFLAAYSGNLAGSNSHAYFVPPVYDLLAPDGEFKRGEAEISAINALIAQRQQSPTLASARVALQQAEEEKAMAIDAHKRMMSEAKARREAMRSQGGLSAEQERALIGESQFQKAELKRLRQHHEANVAEKKAAVDGLLSEITALKAKRKSMSEALQERIFRLFVVNNALGERIDLMEVFARFYGENPTLQASAIPPSGAGECCAPKLLQYAFSHGLTPLCMAEFWWGDSPAKEIRHHGHYYGACLPKCRPILWHMLRGTHIEPRQHARPVAQAEDIIIYEDEWLVVANKPAGMLTVPGRLHDDSLQSRLSQHLGMALKAVHRLDMSTSGIVILAKDEHTYSALQADFASRKVHKRYTAVLDGIVGAKEGTIDLPLRANVDDRPRQMVDHDHGKRAITRYEVIENTPDGRTRIAFFPLTGRTHQLRVHASHCAGLGCPIVGDMLYGRASTRLMLHAEAITFTHPTTKEKIHLEAKAEF
ncbi:MAG: pseudouridine synthase [Bacteroidales bacterium]|nr:pseudouridine synthase [Bacteroidales bacterium]